MKSDRFALEATFARLLLPLSRRWRAVADDVLADLGLSHASGWALLHADRLEPPVTQSAVAEALDLTGPSVVRLIDRLESDGLLVRRSDPQDRRVNHLRLTDAGAAVVGRIETALTAVRRELLADIDDDALDATISIFRLVDSRLLDRQGRPK